MDDLLALWGRKGRWDVSANCVPGPAVVVADGAGEVPIPAETVVVAEESNGLAVLFHRLADGDERAFGEFYDLTAPKVFAVIVGLVGEGDEADELLAGTYLRLWESAALSPVVSGQELVWVLQLMFQCRADQGAPNEN